MADLLYRAPIEHEPLKKNRFILRFPADLGISEWTVESAQRPHININPVEMPFLNTSTWVAGRYKWESINVSFRDFIAPSTAQALMEWARLCAESVTGRMGYAAGYKRDIEFELLDPAGNAIQRWILVNCWLSDIQGGDFTHSDDAVATLSGTLVMDYAILAY